MSSTLVDTKSLLAKLLASENITIVHARVSTAKFNMKTRVLTCPIWRDMDGDLYDLLMGHEVGHALHTPLEGWHDNLVDNKSFKPFLNVVEDARIEKLIKIKYPGLRKSFSNAYKSFLDRDFFGVKDLNGDYSKLNLIDRLNLHAKAGHLALVKFNDVEQVFVDRSEKLETFEDALQLAKDVQAYCKEQEQDKINNTEQLQDAIEKALEDARKENEKKSEADKPKDDQADEPIDGQSPEAAEGDSEDADEGEGKSPSESDDENSDEDGKGQSGEDDEGEDDASDGEESNSNEEAEEGDENESKSASGVDDEDGSEEGSGGQNSEEGDEEGTDSEGQESGGEDGDEDGENEEACKANDGGDEGGRSNGESNEQKQEPTSLTDKAFREHEEELIDQNGYEIVFADLPACDLKKVIVPYQVVTKSFIDAINKQLLPTCSFDAVASAAVAVFNKRNKNSISALVSEFDRLKNASQYVRQLTAKSGELDTHKLAKYRFTSDVFKKVTTTTKGKSHGMVLFLDMSGSMTSILSDVIEQLMVMIAFCKRTDTPFDVYGFSDVAEYSRKYVEGIATRPVDNAFGISSGDAFHLKHLASSEMSEGDYKKAFGILAIVSTLTYNRYDTSSSVRDEVLSRLPKNAGYFWPDLTAAQFSLGGTPFGEMLIASREIIERFRLRTRCDIVNVIHLTDGEGHGGYNFPPIDDKISKNAVRRGIVDSVTRRRIIVKSYNAQHDLTKLIGELTGCRHIGFYVSYKVDSLLQKAGVEYGTEKRKELLKLLRTNGFFEMPSIGYDNYFYAKVQQDGMTLPGVQPGATNTALLNDFEDKINKSRMDRLLARQFAALIADHVDR